ncbi:MAG TPA: flagellar motor protein MotB [Armatimonadota bacterium]|nr:flagellar motor protein MotB [Armatimonadota bacterium]
MKGGGGDGQRPIIVIRRRGGHEGHHGGAWKVAYADFVTAMMAFFIVMWIMGMSPEVKSAISGYFQDPTGFGKQGPGGLLIGAQGGEKKVQLIELPAKERFAIAKRELEKKLNASPEFGKVKDSVDITVTDDGLRVELLEGEQSLFFELGSAEMKPQTADLLRMIAKELAKLPDRLAIEGHTDSVGYSGSRPDYSNWELSADRANAARRAMIADLREGQLSAVRGLADTQLRDPEHPRSPSNRRVSILVEPKELMKASSVSVDAKTAANLGGRSSSGESGGATSGAGE